MTLQKTDDPACGDTLALRLDRVNKRWKVATSLSNHINQYEVLEREKPGHGIERRRRWLQESRVSIARERSRLRL
jgi:hypothetical protein